MPSPSNSSVPGLPGIQGAALLAGVGLAVGGAAGCEPLDASEAAAAPAAPAVRSAPSPAASSAAVVLPPGRPACPEDMVLVEGAFCPEAEQVCVRHDAEYVADRSKSERCLEYAEPSRCLSSKRRLMRFCIDRFEWPNREGELPQVLVDWRRARATCEAAGKRLCEEQEWLFACEGEEMLPYVYGYQRDPTQCVIDLPYVERPIVLKQYEECLADPECLRVFEKLDQRRPVGSSAGCVSPFGVHDMNGNVNEWVLVAGEAPPRRSGLKGGWWGPVRNRCRPTVRFHDEHDWGYEVGFRCCADALP